MDSLGPSVNEGLSQSNYILKFDPRERCVYVVLKDHADEGVYELLTNCYQHVDESDTRTSGASQFAKKTRIVVK